MILPLTLLIGIMEGKAVPGRPAAFVEDGVVIVGGGLVIAAA
jgi:hypothetical protein